MFKLHVGSVNRVLKSTPARKQIVSMMEIKLTVFSVLIWHGYNVAALNLSQCSILNSTCQKSFYENVATVYAPRGIPEIGVPPLEPYRLKNIAVSAMDFLTAKLIEGKCLGISTCRLLKYQTIIKNFRKIAEIKCARVVIQGTYEISTNPNFYHLMGNISGTGKGSVVFENWYFKFDYPFKLVKRDGGIYTEALFSQGQYVSQVLRKASITADQILVNKYDVTAVVLDYFNKNWKIILDTFGKHFHQISADFYYDAYAKFYNNIPATEYYSDDLTLYISSVGCLRNDISVSIIN